MLRSLPFIAVVLCGLSSAFVADANAAVIVKPTVAGFSTQIGDRQAGFTVTGSEFSAGENLLINNGQPVPMVWPTADQNHTNNWLTNGTTSGFITFELGASPVTLGGLHMWNYNESGGLTTRGSRDVQISFSTTSAVAGFGTPLPFTFSQSTGVNDVGADYLFAGGQTGRWVRIDVLNNYGAAHVGLGEIRFFTYDAPPPPPAPEPSTLVLAAMSVVGMALVRRKRRTA